MVFNSTEHTDFLLRFLLFHFFQITMTKSHKIYPNGIWHVPPEWHGLKYYSALLNKVYWSYPTNIVRVCVTPFQPTTAKLKVKTKSNKQIHFGSKVMASPHEFSCYSSLTCSDHLREELIAYLVTRFRSHIFDYIVYGSSDNQPVRSMDSSVSVFYSHDSA